MVHRKCLHKISICRSYHNIAHPLTNHVGAIILLICFAELALQTRLDLSTDANTVSNFHSRDLITDFNSLANDLVTDADWEWAVSPTASNGVDIGSANTAALNLNVNVTVFEWLWLKLWLCQSSRTEWEQHKFCALLAS